jgi:membrane protease YdiL (CAAX protease family)
LGVSLCLTRDARSHLGINPILLVILGALVRETRPVMAAMTAGALIAAVIAIRTRSLLLPIAIHVALDLPIYYYFACLAA